MYLEHLQCNRCIGTSIYRGQGLGKFKYVEEDEANSRANLVV